jgi:hypothetical protein
VIANAVFHLLLRIIENLTLVVVYAASGYDGNLLSLFHVPVVVPG